MDYIQHPSNNWVYGAPKGHDQAVLPVGALPVTCCVVEGQPAIQSYWKPTPEELEYLQRGHPVLLTVFGTGHPVVSIGVAA